MKNILFVLLLTVGCKHLPSLEECHLNESNGYWTFHYQEVSGTCGPLQSESGYVNLTDLAGPSCQYTYQNVDEDSCTADSQFVCTTADGYGQLHWTVSLDQGSETFVQGTATVTLNHAVYGSCSSTYTINGLKS